MAGNLVKWWKHKILGGYKQFSVQECATDSEELMYHQVRASSSCSAPPDLLLVSDRENNIPLRSPVVNIIGNTTAPATTSTSPSSLGPNACHLTTATNNNQRHHNHHHHQNNQKLQQQLQQNSQHHHHLATQQQLSLAYNGTKDISASNVKHQKQSGVSNSHSKHVGQQQQQQPQQDCQQQTTMAQDMEGQIETSHATTTNIHSSARHAHHAQQQQQTHHHHQQRSEEHIRLEEFTCDVSVEGGKSSQPLQFSFTFYDLDGHHGKITKDDIVGIVYTIYESIGKSVVVPHSGSKTINVRLTVSPEGKSKANKTKKASAAALVLDSAQKNSANNSASQAARRLHRYRPRKLIKSDEEDDDSNSEKERDVTANNSANLSHVLAHKAANKSHKLNKLKTENSCCAASPNNTTAELANSPLDTIYDNLKATVNATTPESCRECLAAVDDSRKAAISPTSAQQYPANGKTSTTTNEAYMKHVASTRIKMLRKSRKQKHQDCMETRQRSLSVGNETCWKNRHLQSKQPPTQQQLLWHAEQQLNNSAVIGGAGAVDMVDGVQLRNPLKDGKLSATSAQKRNSAECWKSALNRNDLISIIRESMEKNRLCFQLNGKPQANVSPIRHSQTPPQQQQHHQHHLLQPQPQQQQHNKHSQHHTPIRTTSSSQRQRSNTVSKIPTLIANHNNTTVSHHQSSHYPPSSAHHHHRSSSCANTISNNNNSHSQHDTSLPQDSTNSSNQIYHNHPQLHIPIYHQQMAINPAVIAAHNALISGSSANGSASAAGHHSKMNLCGYDSFLHATICGGGLSHSPPPQNVTGPSALASPGVQQHQQIATVQPIMSSNIQNTPKHLSLAVTPNQIKTSKILRSGSYAQTHQQTHANTTQNSPQYHGYQRLPSSSKHNLSALHLVSPTGEKPALDQLDKWRRDQVKNYDQLLYAKLSEKLQQTNLVSSASNVRESNQRRKHRALRQRRTNNVIGEANNVSLTSNLMSNKLCVREDSDYATMLPINGDPLECENLLGQTSDEESHSQHDSPLQTEESKNSSRHVAEGTLVDLDDDDLEPDTPLNNFPQIKDTLLSVESEIQNLHLDDGLEIEEDLEEEDLDEDLEEVADVDNVIAESGRNSMASNDSANPGATLANTNGANTSTTSSSLIHRYVHEHIHHHYHHFEEKEE